MKKKVIIRTHWDYNPGKGKEKTIGKSETIPGDSYTVKELMEKHMQGIDPMVSRSVIGEDNPDFHEEDKTRRPDFDLVDAQEEIMEIDERAKIREEKKLERSRLREEKKRLKEEESRKEEEKEPPEDGVI